jgi:uncharacterized protein YoaH (UPF0181 family)
MVGLASEEWRHVKQPKKPKKHNLVQMVLSEISLVDNPANQHARVSLWKASDLAATIEKRIKELVDGGMSEVDAASQVARELRKRTGLTGDSDNPKEVSDMDVKELEKKLGELEGQVTELTNERDTIKKSADAATATVEAFKKSVEEAGFEVTIDDDGVIKVEKGEEPEYITIDGERIEKSTVPAPMFKMFEKQQKEIERLSKRDELEQLAKRADDELPNLSGTAEQRGLLLKAVDGIEDEAAKEAVVKALKAADGAVKMVFETVGKDSGEADENSDEAKLEKMAKDYAEEHGVSYAVAFSQVTKSGEGLELMKASRKPASEQ